MKTEKTDIVQQVAQVLGTGSYEIILQAVLSKQGKADESVALTTYHEWQKTGGVPRYIIDYCEGILSSEGICMVLINRKPQ